MEPVDLNQKIWDGLYKEGKNILTFPNENLVRYMYYLYGQKDVSKIKILDYGFGSGNNLKFLVDFGFDVYGYEISNEAKNITLNKLSNNFNADKLIVKEGELKFPFESDFFDAVIAWQVLYYNTYDSLIDTSHKIKRILKENGKFIFTMARATDISAMSSTPIGKFEKRIHADFQKDATIVILPDEELIRNTFSMFNNIEIGYFESKLNNILISHWIIYGEK